MLITDNIKYPFDEKAIAAELKTGKELMIQFSEKKFYPEKVLAQLNKLCGKFDKNLAIRFYGHYSSDFDCNILLNIPNVKTLYVDCLMDAKNELAIGQLQKLEKLSWGIHGLKETEILSLPNLKKLKELTIREAKTKALNLEYLKEYKHLKSLTLFGHTKNIEVIGELSLLESLTLNSIKQTPVPFINKLKKLKTLQFLLGGRDNILEIKENDIEHLDITWVRGFNDLSNISNFRKLKTLHIEDNAQLKSLHFDKKFPYLEELEILNCKTFDSLKGLENLPSLKEIRIFKTKLDFDKFINEKLPSKLKILAFYTTSSKEDKRIAQLLKEKGYTDGMEEAG